MSKSKILWQKEYMKEMKITIGWIGLLGPGMKRKGGTDTTISHSPPLKTIRKRSLNINMKSLRKILKERLARAGGHSGIPTENSSNTYFHLDFPVVLNITEIVEQKETSI